MSSKKFWKDAHEYQRILEILNDYWLTEKDELRVCVTLEFEHADGSTQEKRITWVNPNFVKNSIQKG